jgi:hypothetical protein
VARHVGFGLGTIGLWVLACGSNGSPGPGDDGRAGGASSSGGEATLGGSSTGSGGQATSGGRTGAGGAAHEDGGAPLGGNSAGQPSGGQASGGQAEGAGGSAAAEWSATFPTFVAHTIASFSSGYATVIADIDGDQKPDVVALSSASAGLVWFKNPSWQKYTVTTRASQLIYTAPYDVDSDGDLDLALLSDFDMNDTTSGGTVAWVENPGDPTTNQDWSIHDIDAVPTSHRLRWADIDGDGQKELLNLPLFGVGSSAPAHEGPVELKAYAIPSDLGADWNERVLDDTHLAVAHGLTVVDFDGDEAEDVLTAANDGVYLFRPALSAAGEHLGAGKSGDAPNRGSSEVGLGSLGGARFLATIEPWHGTDTVIYTLGASAAEPWTRQTLGADLEHGHGLVVGDLNGDGYDEIVAGGGQGALTQLIYRYVPSSNTWEKIELDVGGVAVSGMDAQDMNGDGTLDIVTIGGSPTNNVVWYENTPAAP